MNKPISFKLTKEQKSQLLKEAGLNWDEVVFNTVDGKASLTDMVETNIVVDGKTWSVS